MQQQLWDDLTKQNNELKAQRDELLAACKVLLAMIDAGWIPPEYMENDAEWGWNSACEEYRRAGATKEAQAAVARVEKEKA